MKERKEYKRLSSLIEILNTKEKGKAKKQIIGYLFNREITYKDYLYLLGRLNISPPDHLEDEMMIDQTIELSRNLSIIDIDKMNYLETKSFIKKMEEKGLKKKYIKDELLNMWEEGKITGFDYRYVVEAMGDEVPIEFLKHAEAIGRYYL